MQDLHPISVVAGACLLLIIALMPVRKDSGNRRAFLGFILATFIIIVALNLVMYLGDFVVDVADETLVKANIDHVRAAYVDGHIPRNMLIIEGSSQTALGLDAQDVEDKLRAAGYDVTVVDLAISGGNLIERYTLMRRFTEEMQRHGLPYSPNTQLLFELHADYDRDPLRLFTFYEDTLQVYHYSEFGNFFYVLQSYHQAGGRFDWPAIKILGDFFTHCMVWTFKVALLPEMKQFDQLTPTPAFTPFQGHPKPQGYNRLKYPDLVRSRRGKVSVAAIEQRVQRVTALFGDSISGYSYFFVPSLDPVKMRYAHAVCDLHLTPVCIDPSGSNFADSLDRKMDYYDRDHLNGTSAHAYSGYFAQQLVAQQVVIK